MEKMKQLLVLLCMLLPLGVFAQEVKFAYVNTQDVFMAMPEVSAMEKTMADVNEGYKKELKTMQDEYQTKYSAFVSQQDSLSENIKLRRMQEIQDILCISRASVYNLLKRNEFRWIRLEGSKYRISKKSFDEWLDKDPEEWSEEH